MVASRLTRLIIDKGRSSLESFQLGSHAARHAKNLTVGRADEDCSQVEWLVILGYGTAHPANPAQFFKHSDIFETMPAQEMSGGQATGPGSQNQNSRLAINRIPAYHGHASSGQETL